MYIILQVPTNSTEPLGVMVLKSRGVFPEARWYWIGVVTLFGFILLFNFLFILALQYLDRKYFSISNLSTNLGCFLSENQKKVLTTKIISCST